MQLTFGNMTLELNIFHLCKKHIHPEEDTLVEEHCYKRIHEDLIESLGNHDEGLLEPSDLLATLPPLKMREENLPLFNGEETQEAVSEAITHGVEVCIPGREQAEPCSYFFSSYHYSGGLST